MTNNDYEVDLQMSDIKTYEDIQRGKPIHSDGVMAHIGIVKRVASHLRGRLPEYMDLDELVQVGMIGLIEATKTFDDTKGVDFELFAKNRIRGAILDEVRKLSPLPRSAISTVREHSEATQRLTSELGRQPTNAEMAEHLGKEIESFEKDRTHAHRFQTESLDAQPAETLDKPADHANEPENLVEKEQLIEETKKLAEKLDSPVCSGYQHNDSFPGSHPLAVGPLGYNGSKAAMELISKADVVLALGTRLNPFSTLPGYGIDYWPKNAKIIQVDMNPDRIGLTKKVTVGICGDAKMVAAQLLTKLSSNAGDINREERKNTIHQTKSAWLQTLTSLDHEDDDPGTVWNKEARERDKDRMSPRQAWRAIQAALPEDVIISSDIGNNCAIGNAYPTFEKGRKYLAPGLFGPCGYGFPAILGAKIGCPDTPVVGFAGDGAFGISMNEMSSCAREEWPAITMVIFRNYQWGAEKRNSILWFDDNFVGTELDPELSYAKVADACGLKGITAKTMEETTKAIKEGCENQKKGITTFVEVILNQELGEPFRRDAMKKPVQVAGISKSDMKPQKSLV